MKDVKPKVWYYRFDPAGHLARAGVYGTVHMGDCEPDRIYPCFNPTVAAILNDHDEWEPVTKRDYDAQCKADEKEQSDDQE